MPYDALLTHRATLEKAAITRDATTGDEVEAWVEKDRDVPCLITRIRPGTNRPIGLAEDATNMVHFMYRTDLASGRWRALIDGVEYRLVDYYDPGNRHHHTEMAARRMS